MTRSPVAAAPRPMFALLSDAMRVLLDPPDASASSVPGSRSTSTSTSVGAYAAFEAPTYQRRGIRIAGLDEPVTEARAGQSPRGGSPVR
jgi:hypothetical protein